MCRTFLVFLLVTLAFLVAPCRVQADLTRFHDKNRVLLVFAPSASDSRWVRQDALLAGSRARFSDRELLRFDVFENSENRGRGTPLPAEGPSTSGHEAIVLRERYHVRHGSFRVLLVGKDGQVAFDGSTPLRLSDLIERIDRMPMRRDEMRRRAAGTRQ